MYKCLKCEKEFEYVTIKRITDADGEKRIFCCPFCESLRYEEQENKMYCRCCGAKLRHGVHMFCTVRCKKDYYDLEKQAEIRKKQKYEGDMYKAMREVDVYNKEHDTKYSYGEYFALKEVNGI